MENINPIIFELLKKRGIEDKDEILEFLSDKPQKTHNPFLLHNLEAGVDLILSSARAGKQIVIYGDYDADGVTSVVLMREILLELTDKVSYYIPSRFDEGYGLNIEAIDNISKKGGNVIITVDCGSVSRREAAYAQSLGMDIIITDHHSINDEKADCILINPKQKECSYPFKHLAGVGVAFKFAQGLQKKANLPKSTVNRLLDLVAIGTVGDIVPLIDENRTMVKYGLNILNTKARPGINTLVSAISNNSTKISSERLAFGVIPYINAAGRMDNACCAVEAIIAGTKEEALDKVAELVESNSLRKKIQSETYDYCIELAENQCLNDEFKLIEAENAHEGVAGIVAGKIKDKYSRPSVIVTDSDNGTVKGTGRSPEAINLYELLSNCAELFQRFGGHSGACGFTMEKHKVPELRRRINEVLSGMIAEDSSLFDIKEKADLIALPGDITKKLTKELEVLEPFGSGNTKPVFMIKNVTVSTVAYMGNNKQHVRFMVKGRDGAMLQCVLFSRADEFADLLEEGMYVEIFGTPEYSEWNGTGRIQFFISGMRGMNI
ncbi:MAG: single-stranded-DNA-specific exonuclease RecJ [Eubacteriales bacterium]|nr:single-stranded-DNA-specific exonuclease RecJ [Eubacteriales bacterium]